MFLAMENCTCSISLFFEDLNRTIFRGRNGSGEICDFCLPLRSTLPTLGLAVASTGRTLWPVGPLIRQGGAAGAHGARLFLNAPYDRTRALLPVGGTLPVARRPLVGGRGDYTVPRVYAWLLP